MQTEEDSLMFRYMLLIFFTILVEACTVSSVVRGNQPLNQKIVVEGSDSVYLFDTDNDAEKYNTKNCYNVYVDDKNLKKIKNILKKGKDPKLKTTTVKSFFNRSLYDQPNTSIFFHYKRKPIDDFCQREDLIVIKSVKEK